MGVSFVKVIVLQNSAFFFSKCIYVEMDTYSVTFQSSDSQQRKPPEVGVGVSFVKVIVLQNSAFFQNVYL